jgi:hypothetical protein
MNKKIIVGIIVVLLLSTGAIPTTNQRTTALKLPVVIPTLNSGAVQNETQVTCYVTGKLGLKHITVTIPTQTAIICYAEFHQLIDNMTNHPFSEKTQQLKQDFITLLVKNNLLPADIPLGHYNNLLNPPWFEKLRKNHNNAPNSYTPKPIAGTSTAAAVLCSITGEGVGVLFPFLMLPRPRLIATWAVLDGYTTVGKFLTFGGFTAQGSQFGTALGFWGIGLAFAFPYGNIYGFGGYALFAAVTAQYIERYPPDNPPIILGTNPIDGAQNVPVSLSELRFSIEDPDGDLMSYTVTTNPDIGSGSGSLKPAGTYSIPIHGLQELTQYSWTLKVSDKELTTEQTFTFTTQAVAPIILNPVPKDGERHVPTDLQELQFTIKDFQGDPMDYTVQTSPNIGSGSGADVHNGTYTVAISGLLNSTAYHWYVNATDGTHWARKVFSFQTGFPTHFDPFEKGWHYRKQITISHTNIPQDFTNFPVLVSTVDTDLKAKAQPTGDDILFMNNTGFATILNYEIEQYDGTTGTLIAWVNITQLSSTEDTTFYMYYGNPTVLSQQNPEKTWDSSYLAVLHMNDATASTIVDSTSNARIGMKKAADEPIATSAQIDDGQTFDGSNDYIQFNATIIPTGIKTVSLWFKSTITPSDSFMGVLGNALNGGSQDKGFCISAEWKSGAIITFEIGNVELYGHFLTVSIPVPDSNWHYYVGVYDGTDLRVYRDGSYVAVDNTKDGSEANPNYNFSIGKSNINGEPYFFDGSIDEIRLLNSAGSVNWISTEYKNQNDPAGFLTIGPEVQGP